MNIPYLDGMGYNDDLTPCITPVPFCKFSMLYFCIFLWMLDSNVEHPEVVSSLDLWDFESAHVVCASLVETWRRMIYNPVWAEK